MKISNDELNELLRLAKEATPGPWHTKEPETTLNKDGEYFARFDIVYNKDIKYIAHANPDRITRLVECVRELRAALEEITSEVSCVESESTGIKYCHSTEGADKAREALAKWFEETK